MIEIKNLTKIYPGGIVGVRDVNLNIQAGVFGLLGPNGSGKTTLMRIMATLLEPTEGTITIDGCDVRRDRPQIRRLLGYLPQDFGLYPHLTAFEMLDYLALLCDIKDAAQRKRVIDDALERVHLTEVRDRKVGTFSGGMKQRVGIAQAILNAPRLLIVDEPTAGLDPEERVRVRSLLSELGEGRVIILSTHIVEDVLAVADSLAIMHRGQVSFSGTATELLEQVAGRVWQLELERKELAEIKEQYHITSVLRARDNMQVRLIADGIEHPHAVAVEPTFEDAYIWLMGQ
jgi:ABC-type multidrug transport system ATPase subunit